MGQHNDHHDFQSFDGYHCSVTAFVNTHLDDVIFVRHPLGFEDEAGRPYGPGVGENAL